MLGSLRFNSPKCETNARLCLGRIRLLKNKKNMQMRAYRKDIADLLRQGKLDYAIIRVESVIREQLTLTAYEILELFLELVAVRTAMIAQSKTIPGDMMEAVSSVLYASARCPELEELVKLRALFEQKYGKEYVQCAVSDRECHRFSVNERLARCLTVEPPPPDVKLQALSEIAQEYAVEWDAAEARRVLLGDYGGSILGDAYAAAAAGAGAAGGQQQPGASATGGGGGGGLVYTHSADTGLLAPGPSPVPAQQPPPPPQQQQAPPVPPAAAAGEGGYADIAAAAQAAALAAQQARAAADAAARMAAGVAAAGGHQQQPPPGPPPGGAGGGGGTARPAAPGSAPVLQQGWLAGGMEGFTHAPAAPGGAGGPGSLSGPQGSSSATGVPPAASPPPSVAATAPAAGQPGSSAAASAGAPAAGLPGSSAATGAGAPGGFRVPSAEEIQRAYDAAQGPPPKPGLAAAAAAGAGGGSSSAPAAPPPSYEAAAPRVPMAPPPAAPPVKATDADVAAVSGASANSGSGSIGAELPSVPGGGSGGGGGAGAGGSAAGKSGASSGAASDFDELQRRFEALKKS